MQIPFVKYQGTGNDFILIDDRTGFFNEVPGLIASICHRHFGIGADGLLLLRNRQDYDFEMIYYNSDGSLASFCGNGARCIVAFAQSLEMIGINCRFLAADGDHTAEIMQENGHETFVKLSMSDGIVYENDENHCYLNTGTWHYVEFVENPDDIDVIGRGRSIRYYDRFAPHGTNVNFVAQNSNKLSVRTYEKGVENETLSCGTGVTASAIASSLRQGGTEFSVKTPGGELKVYFKRSNDIFSGIFLLGPTVKVYEGQLSI